MNDCAELRSSFSDEPSTPPPLRDMIRLGIPRRALVRAVLLLLVPVALVGQFWALPSLLAQRSVGEPSTADANGDADADADPTASTDPLATGWQDPITTFGLDGEPLAAVPEFDFSTLHGSAVFEDGVENLAVNDEPDLDEEVERHLRSLQAVATAQAWRARIDDQIATTQASVATATRSIANATDEIAGIDREIAVAESEIAELVSADDDQVTAIERLDDEILTLNAAVAELAVQAFTGEDHALESIIENPGSIEVVERRILTDELREFQRADIDALLERVAEAEQRREALAAELVPFEDANEARAAAIGTLNTEIALLIDQRSQLETRISELEDQGEAIDITIAETQVFATVTAAQYQAAYNVRLDAIVTGTDIPLVALNAYVRASRQLAVEAPGCGIHWSQLAGIGRTESNHGSFGGSMLDVDGNTTIDIIGVPLDGGTLPGGGSLARITDTDGGALDGDRVFDRAVGPMQFIPTTWELYLPDGNDDGVSDPQNVYDAALGSARLLCDAPGSMLTESGEQRAYFAYNHDLEYSANVTRAGRSYYDRLRVAPESQRFAAFSELPTYEERLAAEAAAAQAAAEAAALARAACEAEQAALAETAAAEAAEAAEAPEAPEVDDVTAAEPPAEPVDCSVLHPDPLADADGALGTE